jgi:hypothetical protein
MPRDVVEGAHVGPPAMDLQKRGSVARYTIAWVGISNCLVKEFGPRYSLSAIVFLFSPDGGRGDSFTAMARYTFPTTLRELGQRERTSVFREYRSKRVSSLGS